MLESEWRSRRNLAVAYRLLAQYFLTDLSRGFIDGRIEHDRQHRFAEPSATGALSIRLDLRRRVPMRRHHV